MGGWLFSSKLAVVGSNVIHREKLGKENYERENEGRRRKNVFEARVATNLTRKLSPLVAKRRLGFSSVVSWRNGPGKREVAQHRFILMAKDDDVNVFRYMIIFLYLRGSISISRRRRGDSYRSDGKFQATTAPEKRNDSICSEKLCWLLVWNCRVKNVQLNPTYSFYESKWWWYGDSACRGQIPRESELNTLKLNFIGSA